MQFDSQFLQSPPLPIYLSLSSIRAVRNLGNIELPEPKDGEYVNFVLDGQQRFTSLFAALKGVQFTEEDSKVSDYSQMYVDLTASENVELIITDVCKLTQPLVQLWRLNEN